MSDPITLEDLEAAAADVHGACPTLPSPNELRALRRASGLTAKQLARAIGTSVNAIFEHEQGKRQAWRDIGSERRARRVYALLATRLLNDDPRALAQALELGPAPLRGSHARPR